MQIDMNALLGFLDTGGPALWAIAVLSVLTVAIIAWKLWRLMLDGAWSSRRAENTLGALLSGETPKLPRRARTLRLRFVAALQAGDALPEHLAREHITGVAQSELMALRTGLRPLELIMTIAPLIGLLGTVLGMIDAFQALEDSGGQADPSVLAGGIWEALLTTAAGMAVAIPAAVALSWFEGLNERIQADLEAMATRYFIATAQRAEAA